MKKSIFKKFFATVCTALASVMVFSIAACETEGGGSNVPDGESHGLDLISYSIEVDAGATANLLVMSFPMEDVVWTTSNPSIATVEPVEGDFNIECIISAHSVGIATITASAGADWATCNVGVVAPETITIKRDGFIEDEVALSGKGDTLKLTATSSRKHDIVWESANSDIASVDSKGNVKAETLGGTVDIIARCAQHSNVMSSVKVIIGDGVNTAYKLESSFIKPDIAGMTGTWYYWNEFNNIRDAKYVEGEVSFEAIDLQSGANWYNVQLIYNVTDADKDVAGNSLKANQLYALSFDMDITKSGTVTVNGYVLPVEKGKRTYTVYYKHSYWDGNKICNTGFEMALGVDKESDCCDLVEENFTVKVSNLSWKTETAIQLDAPTFSIDANNLITINDSNPAGSVGSYTLNLYNESDAMVRSVLLDVNEPVINMKKIPAGTYTAQLVANAANAHYNTAPETQVTTGNIVISTTTDDQLVYDIAYGGEAAALLESGSWTYWRSPWVTFVKEYNGGDEYDQVSGRVNGKIANLTFSNNSGFWYDTQLWYKTPGKVKGDTYTVKLHLDDFPVAEDGAVTINGTPYNITEKSTTITLNITETDGASIQIIFGKNGQTDKMPIQAVTNALIWIE